MMYLDDLHPEIFDDVIDPKTHWVTKDKRVIPIKELGDEHLANCINMLMRGTVISRHLIDPLTKEFEVRQLNPNLLIRPIRPNWREGF